MVRCSRRARAGQLVIFDALLFLAVTSVASVGLIAALHQAPEEAFGRDAQGFVEGAHQALLGTTLSRMEGDLGVEVSSLVKGILEHGGPCEPDASWLKAEIGAILENLLQPRFGYVWMAQVGDAMLVVESPGHPYREGTDLHVSSVSVDAGGSGACFVLRAWQA
jgi:hypothetical protein